MKLLSLFFTLLLAALLFAQPAFAIIAPVVTSVSPINGPAAGGTTVQITGSGFTGTTAVTFGTVPVVTYTVNSDASITATSPESFAAGTIDVTVTTIAGTSATSSADQYTYIDGDWYAYVALFNLSPSTPVFQPINLTTNTPGTALTMDQFPDNIAITPNAQLAICPASGTLSLVDLATLAVLPSLPDGFLVCAIAPDGKTAYLTSTTTVTPFDIASSTFGTAIGLPSNTDGIAITPDGLTAFVTTASNNVYPIDLASRTVGSAISAPEGIIQITPDGTKAFISNFSGSSATWLDLTTNPPTPHSLFIGHNTGQVTINPNGTTVYFTSNDNDAVFTVDIATLVVGTVPFSFFVADFAVTPDGKTGYAASGSTSEVVPVDLTTFAMGTPIPVANTSVFIAISPDQAPIASFTVTPALSGFPSTFDASASVSPVGTIVSYLWDFGDGNLVETSTPIETHTYAASGNYTVTLTVTNSAGTSTTQVFTGQTMSRNGGPSAETSQIVQISTLFPPQNVRGFQVENRFLMQDELRNVIVWEAPTTGIPPVAYNIYSDAALTDLVAIVPANGRLDFVQHNVHERSYTYYLISVDALGDVSLPVSVTIRPHQERSSSF